MIIILLISIPGKNLPEVEESVDRFQPDKVVHIFLFLVFLFLLMRGFDYPSADSNFLNNVSFFALFSGIIFSGGTEIFQHFFVVQRNATLKDFLFNALGCLVGWIFYLLCRNRVQHR